MKHYVYVVLTRPVTGKEDEYNRWYTEQHLGDVLRVPGVVAARRFRLAQPTEGAPAPYLATYDIESNDVEATLKEIESLAGTAAMPLSDALDMQNVQAYVYEAITERQAAAGRS